MDNMISVIIPVYNAGKYFRLCLESIINQTYRNIEILLINDGSTDNSGEICDEYAKKDVRIQVFHKKNGGVSSARNLGLKKATGEWISFVDSDDFLELDAYETVINKSSGKKYDIIIYEFSLDEGEKSIPHHLDENWYGELSVEKALEHTDAKIGNGYPFTRFFRRSLVYGENCSGKSQVVNDGFFKFPLRFDETIARGEDGIFVTQIIKCSEKILSIPDVLYHYVQSEESACRGQFRPNQLTFLKLKDFFVPFYERYYPEWVAKYYSGFLELIIYIYFDMYIDAEDYSKEMQDVFREFCENYSKRNRNNSLKVQIKLSLFRINPKLFCKIHKVIWRIK